MGLAALLDYMLHHGKSSPSPYPLFFNMHTYASGVYGLGSVLNTRLC